MSKYIYYTKLFECVKQQQLYVMLEHCKLSINTYNNNIM